MSNTSTAFVPGLVSVTFRGLTPSEIVALVAGAGLAGIEWGGDIHAPHGDIVRAAEVRALTEDAGLVTIAYGSYYCVAKSEGMGLPFDAVLETAQTLGAPTIRVWAGDRDSADCDEAYFTQVVDDSRRIADMSAAAGIRIAYESHSGTIADTAAASRRLLDSVCHANVSTLWQPQVGSTVSDRKAAIELLLPDIAHAHVFHWNVHDPRPLAEGEAEWSVYLDALSGGVTPMPLLLEFVQDGSTEAFLRDAATLKAWIAGH